MIEDFIIIDEIEEFIKLIDKDKSILKILSVNELEYLNDYLKKKKII